jgi:hypothetical protein
MPSTVRASPLGLTPDRPCGALHVQRPSLGSREPQTGWTVFPCWTEASGAESWTTTGTATAANGQTQASAQASQESVDLQTEVKSLTRKSKDNIRAGFSFLKVSAGLVDDWQDGLDHLLYKGARRGRARR